MTERAFGWWVMASALVHGLGISAAALGRPTLDLTPRTVVAIEVVPAPAPPLPPPAPPPKKLAAPRVVERPPAPTPAPRPLDTPAEAPPNLLDTPAPPAVAAPRVDGTLAPSAVPSMQTPVVGGPAGAGRLFDGGDLLVPPGGGSEGGSGAAGLRGSGTASSGAATSNVLAAGTGLTALARPLGGYQVKPEYPESARRDRAQGVALLRFEVLATGRVGEVIVARSAGHRELDRAAIDAIKRWQFEPARRGPTPVPVWVTLPVRFELDR